MWTEILLNAVEHRIGRRGNCHRTEVGYAPEGKTRTGQMSPGLLDSTTSVPTLPRFMYFSNLPGACHGGVGWDGQGGILEFDRLRIGLSSEVKGRLKCYQDFLFASFPTFFDSHDSTANQQINSVKQRGGDHHWLVHPFIQLTCVSGDSVERY